MKNRIDVPAESTLPAMAKNMNKLHNKIRKNIFPCFLNVTFIRLKASHCHCAMQTYAVQADDTNTDSADHIQHILCGFRYGILPE